VGMHIGNHARAYGTKSYHSDPVNYLIHFNHASVIALIRRKNSTYASKLLLFSS